MALNFEALTVYAPNINGGGDGNGEDDGGNGNGSSAQTDGESNESTPTPATPVIDPIRKVQVPDYSFEPTQPGESYHPTFGPARRG